MTGLSQIPGSRRLLLAFTVLFAAGAVQSFAADGASQGRVAERVSLKNGFELTCDHREENGDRVRLYSTPNGPDFVEVATVDVVSVETITLPPDISTVPLQVKAAPTATHADLTKTELHELLTSAGAQHNLDVNLLASVVRAESGGHTAAVSKKGAQGLMQLMPRTAAQLGVSDSLRPEQNVAGGASYLDTLLTRYHDNLALALAAYNAGPAAVDRWHGVPPYQETRLYVARIIRDFNASVRRANREASLSAARLSQSNIPSLTDAAHPDREQASLTGATAP